MFSSPFEQFELTLLESTIMSGYDLSDSNISLYLTLVFCVILSLTFAASSNMTMIANSTQLVMEMIYIFINNLLQEQAGPTGRFFFPAFMSIFCLY